MKVNIVGNRYRYFSITLLIIAACIVSLAVFRLTPGIEFSSGSMLVVSFESPVVAQDVEAAIADTGYDAIVQKVGNEYLIRTKAISADEKTTIEDALSKRFGKTTESQFSSVSPLVASETATNAGIAVLASMVGILLYVTWAFRVMPRPFHYGVCCIIALCHDVLVSVGIYSILAAILRWEIDLMFVTGVMAIIGISVNNIVIIFDRIRENLRLGVSPDFAWVVNNSVVETLTRSLNTNITILITLVALMLFVGASIQSFIVVLTLGCIVGVWSSVFVAPSLLVTWDKHEWGRFIDWFPGRAKSSKA